MSLPKNETKKSVVLQCQRCKEWETYELPLFKRAWKKEYLKDGFIPQYCDCDNSNQPHKIKGLLTETILFQKISPEEILK